MGVLKSLSVDENELRVLALIRLAGVERHAGRLDESLSSLSEAAASGEMSGPWPTARCNIELASTYKDLAISKELPSYFDMAKSFYFKALLLCMGELSHAEEHLLRARNAFDLYADRIRCAQVDDSLARLYLAQGKLDRASEAIERAVNATERGDEDLLLAEALTTTGLIYCKRNQFGNARRVLEDAHRLAFRCGDNEGAGRALLVLIEKIVRCSGMKNESRPGLAWWSCFRRQNNL